MLYLFRTQRNARVEGAVGVGVVALGLWLGLPSGQWATLVLCIAAVLILEGINTAVEAAVDLASPALHPLAKTAKDLAAGCVLIASIASAIVGLLILGPPLWARVFG